MPSRRVAALCVGLSLSAPLGCERKSTLEITEPEPTQDAAGTEDPAEARMREMAEMAEPGPEHDVLKELVGSWAQNWTYSLDPDHPVHGEARVEASMVLGGRFLWMETRGGDSRALDSVVLLGFDRRHEEFTIYGCDSGGTHCVTARGGYDAGAHTITMTGEDDDPVAGVTQRFDIIMRVAPTRFTTEVVFAPGSFGNDAPVVGAQTENRRLR